MDTIAAIVFGTGIAFMIIGTLMHLGTSKAERSGRVQIDDKKKKRIKLGYILMTIGIGICIIGALVLANVKK